jgi:hypothetical protein
VGSSPAGRTNFRCSRRACKQRLPRASVGPTFRLLLSSMNGRKPPSVHYFFLRGWRWLKRPYLLQSSTNAPGSCSDLPAATSPYTNWINSELRSWSKPSRSVVMKPRQCCPTPRFSCDNPASLVFLPCMNRLKTLVSLMVLALWATCTLRCEMEVLASSAPVSCCDEAGEESDQAPAQPQHCICSFVQSGGFIVEKSNVPIPLPNDALFTSTALPKADVTLSALAPAELTFSPPELRTSWQFSFRAALSPRAPSFVS